MRTRPPHRWIVAIPARDEVLRIEGALQAVSCAAGETKVPVAVLVYANNCFDATSAVSRQIATTLRNVDIEIVEHDLSADDAHAGGARRTAVERSFAIFGAKDEDLLLSTDADTRVGTGIFRQMEIAFTTGAELVLAKIDCVRDPYEPCSEAALAWGFPAVLWRSRVRQLVETVRRGYIPKPPLHDDYGGAGLAVRVGVYRALGGFPPIATNEDKTLVTRADARGMVVNRQSAAVVHVLARARGRAAGGMADAIAHDEIASAEKRPMLVEHHAVTIERILRNPSHAHAFAATVARWEPAPDAIAALDRAIDSYSHKFGRQLMERGAIAG